MKTPNQTTQPKLATFQTPLPLLSTFIPYVVTRAVGDVDETRHNFKDYASPLDEFRQTVHSWQRSALASLITAVQRNGVTVVTFDVPANLHRPAVWALGGDETLVNATIDDYLAAAENESDQYEIYKFHQGGGRANLWWNFNTGTIFSCDSIAIRRIIWPLLVNQAASNRLAMLPETYNRRLDRLQWKQHQTVAASSNT